MLIPKNNKKCVIYLADLVHNYTAKGPHTFPINIGYITAYAKKIYGEKLHIKLFKYPQDLLDAIKEQTPHIIGMSNYTWNLDINRKITSWVKSLSKDIVTVFGGPDLPSAPDEYSSYLKTRPDLDFHVIDQGEKGFTNILERFFDSGSIKDMKSSPVQNCVFYDRNNNISVTSDKNDFIENINEIPSPYLEGIMDEFFDDNLNPLIETNRGCPYLCTYCAWGRSTQKKIYQFSLERITREIEYIAKRIKNTDMLMMGDANFGILERDVEIAKFIRTTMNKHGYPRNIFVAWAKSGTKRMMKMVEILKDIFGVTSTFGSFQSLDPLVTKNIKRTNLSLDEFRDLQDYFRSKNISTSSELILALPGETKASHRDGLKDLFDFNAPAIFCYNLRMIGGSTLNTRENRKKFGIKTKYRLIDGGFGKYDDIVSIEHEEMVLETDSMTTDDILYFRPIHFLIQFLWNYKYYEELLHFLKNEHINPMDLILSVIDNTSSAPPLIKELFDNFMTDAHDEWFDSEKDLVDHYSKPENFKLICKGGFGKLNYKYTYKILLECREVFDQYLFETTSILLKEHDKYDNARKTQLNEIIKYTKNRFVDFSKGFENLAVSKKKAFEYDILKWKEDSYQKTLSEYLTSGTEIDFLFPEEQKSKLAKLYAQYKAEDINQTLRKMVEYMNERDLFRQVVHA